MEVGLGLARARTVATKAFLVAVVGRLGLARARAVATRAFLVSVVVGLGLG